MTDSAKAASKKLHRTAASKVTPVPDKQKPLPLGSGARKNARVVLALVLVGPRAVDGRKLLPALIWATILAVALWPLYMAFAKRLHGRPLRSGGFRLHGSRRVDPGDADLARRVRSRPAKRLARRLAEASARGRDRSAGLDCSLADSRRKHGAMVARQSFGSESCHGLAQDAQCRQRIGPLSHVRRPTSPPPFPTVLLVDDPLCVAP